mgnify:CR=1 FL=1
MSELIPSAIFFAIACAGCLYFGTIWHGTPLSNGDSLLVFGGCCLAFFLLAIMGIASEFLNRD